MWNAWTHLLHLELLLFLIPAPVSSYHQPLAGTALTVSGSNITSLTDITIPAGVTHLTVQSSSIEQLNRTQILHLSSSTLVGLLMNGNPQLTTISPGTFQGTDKLSYISIIHNKNLSTYKDNFTDCPDNLLTLHLRYNGVKSWDPAISITKHCSNLKKLCLSGNNIINFPDLSALTQLKFLRLEDNMIAAVPADAFAGLVSIQRISLENNPIIAFLPDLSPFLNIQIISLGGSDLTNFSLAQLPSSAMSVGLTQLWLTHISEPFPAHVLGVCQQSLNELHLEFDGSKAFPEQALDNHAQLRTVTLTGLLFEDIPHFTAARPMLTNIMITESTIQSTKNYSFETFHNLVQLNLSYSGIVDIPTFNTNITELHLHDNAIQEIPNDFLMGLPTVTNISLACNNITDIPNLGRSHTLIDLRLNNNRISYIAADAFTGITKLEVLSLQQNQLKTLHPVSSATIYIADNPLMCNLKLSWMKEPESGVQEEEVVYCDMPPAVPVSALTPANMEAVGAGYTKVDSEYVDDAVVRVKDQLMGSSSQPSLLAQQARSRLQCAQLCYTIQNCFIFQWSKDTGECYMK